MQSGFHRILQPKVWVNVIAGRQNQVIYKHEFKGERQKKWNILIGYVWFLVNIKQGRKNDKKNDFLIFLCHRKRKRENAKRFSFLFSLGYAQFLESTKDRKNKLQKKITYS